MGSCTSNNTATTTYTFTPAAGQCATTATMTITVNPKITPTFTQIAAICSGDSLAALPTTSNNGITGTWAPASTILQQQPIHLLQQRDSVQPLQR